MQLFVIQGLPSPPVNLWDELYSSWLVPIGERKGAVSMNMSEGEGIFVKVFKFSSAKTWKMRRKERGSLCVCV